MGQLFQRTALMLVVIFCFTKVWAEKRMYARLSGSGSDKTISFYYDENMTEGDFYQPLIWGTFMEEEAKNITHAIFDSSFAEARPTSTANWFRDFENLQSVDGISYLNTSQVTDMSFMFYWCSSLTNLDVSKFDTSNVTNMSWMFNCCKSLSVLDVSNFDTGNVTDMSMMFADCGSVTCLDVSNFNTSKVTSMGDMFSNCRILSVLDVSNFDTGNVVDMVRMFYCCSSLTSLDVSNFNTANMTNMGDMFHGCSSLTSLDVSNFVTDNVANMTYMFSRCSSLTELNLLDFVFRNVTDISGMFRGCFNLERIYCKEDLSGVETGDNIFDGCGNLKGGNGTSFNENNIDKNYARPDVVGQPGYFSTVKENEKIIEFADATVKALCIANWDTDGDGELNYGEAAAVKGRLGGVFSNNKEIISFNEFEYFTGVSTLGYEEFSGCSSLTSVIIPNSVTSLGFYAFQDCSSLTSIEIPNTVISIESGAFRNCKGLTSIEIPNSVTTIYFGAFQNCSSLTSITIPNSVTGIGQLVFSGCDNLSSLAVELGNTKYDSRDNCNAIIETESNTLIIGCNKTKIPNSVVSIDSYSFQSCKGMTSIEIPNNVTRIGDSAFGSCSSLTSVTIPKNVINIGKNLFSGCENLSSIVVESGNTGYDSRNDCNAIIETESNTLIAGCNKTKIPNSVTKIGEWAFSGCNGLTSITIPNSVTSIGEYAFVGCFDLTEVIINISKPLVLSSQFDFANSANATLYVPKGCVEAYASADNWKEFKEIVEISPGDADGDGNVDQKDVNLVVEYIMNGKTEDLNLINATGSDRKVLNVADIVRIINIMKNK